jgi:hypothetical protein
MGEWFGFPLEQSATGYRRMIKEVSKTKGHEPKQHEIAARNISLPLP